MKIPIMILLSAVSGIGGAGTDGVLIPKQPPTDMLSDAEVKLAMSGDGKGHWTNVMDLWSAGGAQQSGIGLYMPEATIARQSESAKKQFTQYEPTEEDKRRSLVILGWGRVGKLITDGCQSITRIVLLSEPSGGVVEEAYLSESIEQDWHNNMGATNQCTMLRAKFSLADVRKVRAAAPQGEFFVAVFAGSVNTKTYKIKRKFQSKMDLQ
jgi:hypothetical protein